MRSVFTATKITQRAVTKTTVFHGSIFLTIFGFRDDETYLVAGMSSSGKRKKRRGRGGLWKNTWSGYSIMGARVVSGYASITMAARNQRMPAFRSRAI